MNLKKIAQMALVDTEDAFMTLQEHDRRYHDSNYHDGDECLFRERLAAGDDSDEALKEANSLEAASYYAKAHEREYIGDLVAEVVPIVKSAAARKRYGAYMRVMPQKKNFEYDVVISTFPVVPDNAVDPNAVKHIFEDLIVRKLSNGQRQRIRTPYKLKGVEVKNLRSNKAKNGGLKVFTITLKGNSMTGAIARPHKGDSFVTVDNDRKELSETEKSMALKRFGLKMEDGRVMKRGNQDMTPQEKYLAAVNSGWRNGLGALRNKTNAQIKAEREEEAKAKDLEEFRRMIDMSKDWSR